MLLETAIAAQTESKAANEVVELVLDTCRASRVSGLDKFANLKKLHLNGCGLTTLEGFPSLPKLEKLSLGDNNLSDGLEVLQDSGLVWLRHLGLANNKFSTIEQLKPLYNLPSLRDLDLFECPVTELPDYRDKVFVILPDLTYLDGFDADGVKKLDSDDDDDEEDVDEEDDDLLDSELEQSEGGDDDDEEGGEDLDSGLEEGEEDDFGEDDVKEGEEGDSLAGEAPFGIVGACSAQPGDSTKQLPQNTYGFYKDTRFDGGKSSDGPK